MSQINSITPTSQMLMTSTTMESTKSLSFPVVCETIKPNVQEQTTDIILRASTIIDNYRHDTSLDLENVQIPGQAESNFPSSKNAIRIMPAIKLLATPHATDSKRKFVCPYENCTKSYGKSSHLRSHLTWHTGIKPFVCTETKCGKGFTRSDELNRHLRTHTGEKPFECVQCSKKFSRSDHLTKHLATHNRQEKSNNTKRSLPSTIKLKSMKKNVAVSESGIHFMAVLDGCDPNGGPHPQTQHQELAIIDHAALRIKMERPEHTEKYQIVAPVPKNQLASDFCEKANVKYEIEDEMVGAISQLPPQDGPSTYGMPHFIQERPFHCRQCEKRFKRQDDLNRHIRTHTGEKPYACTQCCRRFVRSDHLKKHQQIHLKSR